MVVRHVQCGGSRRGHPGAVGAGLGVAHFGGEHLGHEIRHGPHAFADLRPALQAAGQTHVDVPVLIGVDPGLPLHGTLGGDSTGFHAGVNLIAGAVKETGVDEHHALARATNTLGEVHGSTTLFVHDADFEGIAR